MDSGDSLFLRLRACHKRGDPGFLSPRARRSWIRVGFCSFFLLLTLTG